MGWSCSSWCSRGVNGSSRVRRVICNEAHPGRSRGAVEDRLVAPPSTRPGWGRRRAEIAGGCRPSSKGVVVMMAMRLRGRQRVWVTRRCPLIRECDHSRGSAPGSCHMRCYRRLPRIHSIEDSAKGGSMSLAKAQSADWQYRKQMDRNYR